VTKNESRFRVTCGIITAADPAYASGVAPDCVIKFKAKNGICLATTEEIPEDAWIRVTSITVRTPMFSSRAKLAWIRRRPVSLMPASLMT
jgi:hypothetical protein